MAIPTGYRLLNINDVGKTFGVELDASMYFDKTAVPPNNFATTKVVRFTLGDDTKNIIAHGQGTTFGYEWSDSSWLYKGETSKVWQFPTDSNNPFTNIKGMMDLKNRTISYINSTWAAVNNFVYVKDSDYVRISYNGAVIGNATKTNKTANLLCANKKAASDILASFMGDGFITYKGAKTLVNSGQTATLICKDKKIEEDVTIVLRESNTLIGKWDIDNSAGMSKPSAVTSLSIAKGYFYVSNGTEIVQEPLKTVQITWSSGSPYSYIVLRGSNSRETALQANGAFACSWNGAITSIPSGADRNLLSIIIIEEVEETTAAAIRFLDWLNDNAKFSLLPNYSFEQNDLGTTVVIRSYAEEANTLGTTVII